MALSLSPLLAACGEDDGRTTTERSESPSLPAASPTPVPTPAATEPPTATAPSAPAPPEDAEGGAGDEEAARTPVSVVVDAEGITPPRLEVPAFLALRVTVRNDLPRAVVVALRGGHRGERIAARTERAFDADGLQPGEYPLDAGAAGRATLVAVRP